MSAGRSSGTRNATGRRSARQARVVSPESARAVLTLRASGFRVDAQTGSFRLLRSDGSQAQLYSLDGKTSLSGNLGSVADVPYDLALDRAILAAVPIASAILRDEATRLALGNRTFGKSLESNPYG